MSTRVNTIIGKKKGFRGKDEKEKLKKGILDEVWQKKQDPKTMTQVLLILKVSKVHKSTVHRYLEEMVAEKKLFKEGSRKGSKYRPNKAKIMSQNHLDFYTKKLFLSENSNSFQLLHYGVTDISLLGLPPEDQLESNERLLLKDLLINLNTAWTTLYELKGNVTLRQKTGKQWIDAKNDPDRTAVEDELIRQKEDFAFLVTYSMRESKEFGANIENVILKSFENTVNAAAAFDFNKYQEMSELLYDIFENVLSVLPSFSGKFPLTDEEKVRISDMQPLLKRYKKENIEIIIEVFEKTIGKYSTKTKGNEAADIYEFMNKALKQRNLLKDYSNNHF